MAVKQLGALDVDGVTYVVDTPHTVYTSPSGGGAAGSILSNISIVNRNPTTATNVSLWICANGDSAAAKNTILPAISIGAKLTMEVEKHAIEPGGTVVFQSGMTDVNCVISGDEK
jgi:hypothetical protein